MLGSEMTCAEQEQHAVIEREVQLWTVYYLKRVSWASEDDLRNEGWVAAREAQRTYQPARGRFGPYVGRAIHRALAAWCLVYGSPVSALNRGGDRKHLYGLRAESVAVLDPDMGQTGRAVTASPHVQGVRGSDNRIRAEEPLDFQGEPTPEDVVADNGWRRRVSARLHDLAGEEGALDLLGLLTGDSSDRTDALCAKLAADERLRALWEERRQ
jgi:hypothetical protein